MRESFRRGIQVKIDDNYFPTGELRMDRAIYMMSVNTEVMSVNTGVVFLGDGEEH